MGLTACDGASTRDVAAEAGNTAAMGLTAWGEGRFELRRPASWPCCKAMIEPTGPWTRRSFLWSLGLLTVAGSALAGKPLSTAERRFVLVPIGPGLDDRDAAFVRQCLEAFYDFDVDVFERQKLPSKAYYAPRHRFRAERLLEFLERTVPPEAVRVLGLTAVDISTTKGSIYDWGVLGLATLDGRVGVLSNFRCRRGARSITETRVRFGKTAVHETGHTLGLEHCPTVGCLMEDGKGTVFTTDREFDLCPRCRKRLQILGRSARESPVIPWPKPSAEHTPDAPEVDRK